MPRRVPLIETLIEAPLIEALIEALIVFAGILNVAGVVLTIVRK